MRYSFERSAATWRFHLPSIELRTPVTGDEYRTKSHSVGHGRMPGRQVTAVSMFTDIGTLIVRSPEIRGGRPRVAGTGVTVRRIVGWYQLGLSAEEIVDRIGHLTIAQVYAALTYYHANREEIDTDLAEEAAVTEALEREHGAGPAARP